MKAQIRFLANAIKISPHKWPFISLIILGIALAVTGLLMVFDYMDAPYIIEKLLFGTGIVIFSSGLLCLLNQHNIIVSINSSRGIIEIRDVYMLKSISTAFPIVHFSKISVIEQIGINSRHTAQFTYQVCLECREQTSLLLSEFCGKEKALKFAEKLQELILLDIFFREKVYKKSEFKLKASNIPDDIKLPGTSRVRKIQKESEIVLKWQSYYNLLSFLLLSAILYGFYYITAFIIVHKNGLNLENLPGYIMAGTAAFIVTVLFLSGLFRIKTVRLDKEAVKFYTRIFGIKTGFAQVNWDDVYCIRNSINAPVLYVISKEANETAQELMESSAFRKDNPLKSSVIDKINSLKKLQLKINISALPVSDRIRLEQEILNFML